MFFYRKLKKNLEINDKDRVNKKFTLEIFLDEIKYVILYIVKR